MITPFFQGVSSKDPHVCLGQSRSTQAVRDRFRSKFTKGHQRKAFCRASDVLRRCTKRGCKVGHIPQLLRLRIPAESPDLVVTTRDGNRIFIRARRK